MWYELDYKKLTVLLLPTFLRKQVLVSYLNALIAPIESIYDDWYFKRGDDGYILEHTGQVCFLRKVLNDRFDLRQRRIDIGDGNAFERQYIYTKDEHKPVYIGKMFIYRNSEYVNIGVDFIVKVPQDLFEKNKEELNVLIRMYKLAGKRYSIVTI